MVLAVGFNRWLSPGGLANNRMQVTPSAADYYERSPAWVSDSVLFRVSRAPNAESLASSVFFSFKFTLLKIRVSLQPSVVELVEIRAMVVGENR